jgi:hypothetical protein
MVAFESITDVIKALPNLARMQAWRSISMFGGPAHPAPQAAHRHELSPFAHRWQPVFGHLHLLADPHLGAALGRALGHGRHRRHRASAGQLAAGAPQFPFATTPLSPASSVDNGTATGVSAGQRRGGAC